MSKKIVGSVVTIVALFVVLAVTAAQAEIQVAPPGHRPSALQQAPSGRAKHYLNLTRPKLLEGAVVDPPRIDVDPSSAAVWTRERSRVLSGTAHGQGYVHAITVGAERQFVELAQRELAFSQRITLRPGSK